VSDNKNPVAVITEDILATKPEFQAVLCDPSINFEREAEFAIQVLEKNNYAMTVAMNNRSSVVAAVKNIAAIGISLNPAKKQAYLVPRGGAICLDISYMGLLDLAIASGSIRWGQARLVYEQDVFEENGVDQAPIHKRQPFAKGRLDRRVCRGQDAGRRLPHRHHVARRSAGDPRPLRVVEGADGQESQDLAVADR
jgi:recombination protein RecT